MMHRKNYESKQIPKIQLCIYQNYVGKYNIESCMFYTKDTQLKKEKHWILKE